jgi:pyruvate ferredoxin oxidoreductase beta subunit
MPITPKELAKKIQSGQAFSSGGRWCASCPAPAILRTVLAAAGDNVVASSATGCMEVTSTIYPDTTWGVPWIHNTFENAAVTLTGVESAHRYIEKVQKKSEASQKASKRDNESFQKDLAKFTQNIKGKKIKFVAFGGDGGTYDIGLQSLSGSMERGHDFVYVCYNNGAYMNTVGQRSSATPHGASTTTAPAGKVHQGKEEYRKNLVKICLAHGIPYVAQASASNLIDL